MSERIPSPEDILLALTTVGYTEDEAAAGIDQIKRRGISIGHIAAQENMLATIGEVARQMKVVAWDEGYAVGQTDHDCDATNPYREETHE